MRMRVTYQRAYAESISEAKGEETRTCRAERTLDELRAS